MPEAGEDRSWTDAGRMLASSAANCKASILRAGRSNWSRVAAAAATAGSTDAKSAKIARRLSDVIDVDDGAAAVDAGAAWGDSSDDRLAAATGDTFATELELN
jgi:hypothetical protein